MFGQFAGCCEFSGLNVLTLCEQAINPNPPTSSKICYCRILEDLVFLEVEALGDFGGDRYEDFLLLQEYGELRVSGPILQDFEYFGFLHSRIGGFCRIGAVSRKIRVGC